MKVIFTFSALAVVAILIFLSYYNKSESFMKSFEQAAWKQANSTRSVIKISEITDFKWDKFFIFSPYTPIEKIHSQIGYKWKAADKTHIDSSENFNLLVFVRGGEVIRFYRLQRSIGDFQSIEANNIFTERNDAFYVRYSPVSSNRLIFIPTN